jgi:glutamate racemase
MDSHAPASSLPVDPIGVFDSGVGGLSVLRAIRSELPAEHLLYVADSAYAPYGERSDDYIEKRSTDIVQFLLERRSKAIVVACNTATGVSIAALRERFDVPLVGIEPAVKPAALTTKSGFVGVLATSATLQSAKFARLAAQFGQTVEIVEQPCPGLVEQVEAGQLTAADTRALVRKYVQPLIDRNVDTLVLGCTHYPFLEPIIREIAGRSVTIIDPAVAVARELRRVLASRSLLAGVDRSGGETFFTSGSPATVSRVVAELWAPDTPILGLPERREVKPIGTSPEMSS